MWFRNKLSSLAEVSLQFSITSRSIFLIFRNASKTIFRGNQNTHFVFGEFIFFSKIGAFMTIRENIVEASSPEMTMWRLRVAHWITKATNTHSQYVMLTAFPLQQWSRERFSMWRYTYIACLVCYSVLVDSSPFRPKHVVTKNLIHIINIPSYNSRRSQWPRGLRRRSAAARLLRSWVRFPPEGGMDICLLWVLCVVR